MMRIDNLDKRYGDKRVLEGFSLTLPSQGVVALLGPSGCGKTTLLRLLAGLERPDGGALRLPENCKVSMVFQEDRLLPVLSVLDNVRAVLGPGEADAARACLAGCGLGEVPDQYPDQLSGGMRRRVAVARALAFRGDLLLLDEPFKGQDPQTKRQVMDFVFHSAWRARLSVLVTHDLDEALDVADEILVAQGIPLRVLDRVELEKDQTARDSKRDQNRTRLLTRLGAMQADFREKPAEDDQITE